MADNDTTLSETQINELPEGARAHLRRLEKDNKRIGELEGEINRMKTMNAIRDSGMDLNERQVKALLASHDGDNTSPEAYRKTAEELGFVQPEPETPPGAEQAHQQLADARRDAQPTGTTSYEDEVATANSQQELAAIAAKHGRPFAPA